jgi:ABC-2 type transport system permease protein
MTVKLIRDTWLMYDYAVRTTLRNPVWVIVGVFQPILWLLLYAPLLDRIADRSPGFAGGDALKVFTPGILVMLALFGTLFVGFGLIAELRAGVLERLAVTPASRLSLVLGRVLRDITVLLVQSVLLIGTAMLMGLRADAGGVVTAMALMVVLGLLSACCSYALALALRSEDALAPSLQTVTQPLFLLSGIVLPLALAPRWMREVAKINPLAQTVDATRDLFLGSFGADTIVRAFMIVGVLAALGLVWAARSFRKIAA